MPKHVKELKGQLLYRASNMIVLLELRVSGMWRPLGTGTLSVGGFSTAPSVLCTWAVTQKGALSCLVHCLAESVGPHHIFILFFLFNSVGGNENISTVTTLPSK